MEIERGGIGEGRGASERGRERVAKRVAESH